MDKIFISCFLVSIFLGCHTGPREAKDVSAFKPDTSLAKPLDRWPNEADIARLESAKGKTKAQVLKILGHPKEISFNSAGLEIWDYPWLAVQE